jgi:hypothetical protein
MKLFKSKSGIRIFEVAKIIGVPNKEVIDYLNFVGVPVRSASSKINFIEAEVVTARLNELKKDFAPIYAKAPF